MLNPVMLKLESFGAVSSEDRAQLAGILALEARKVEAKVDIIREGDEPDCAHILIDGLACRYKMLDNGRRQIVAFLIPGDFCDLHTFMLQATDHSIMTLTPSLVADVTESQIDKLMSLRTLFKPLMISTLVDEAILREWITNIGQRPAAQRVAHLLCELHARYKRVNLTEESGFDLPIVQADLADTVGLSVVH